MLIHWSTGTSRTILPTIIEQSNNAKSCDRCISSTKRRGASYRKTLQSAKREYFQPTARLFMKYSCVDINNRSNDFELVHMLRSLYKLYVTNYHGVTILFHLFLCACYWRLTFYTYSFTFYTYSLTCIHYFKNCTKFQDLWAINIRLHETKCAIFCETLFLRVPFSRIHLPLFIYLLPTIYVLSSRIVHIYAHIPSV